MTRVKRSILTAFFLSILLPGSGLLYMHKPFAALLSALCFLAVTAAVVVLDLLADFQGVAICLGIVGAVWLCTLVVSLFLARRGLSPESAQHDIGPWIAAFLLVMYISAGLIDTSAYTGYAVSAATVPSALKEGDYVLGRRIDREHPPVAGELVVFTDYQGDGRRHIQQVIAVEGDVLELQDGRLLRNGLMEEVSLAELPGGVSSLVVPPRSVMVADSMGGERVRPLILPTGLLSSRLLYIYWSSDFKRLGMPAH